MFRAFLVAIYCITISGCSFFSTSVDTAETVKSSVGRHINTVSGFKTAKVTELDRGGKKYVIVNRFEAAPPSPCGVSPFDNLPMPCALEFGLPGLVETKTYYVDTKGTIFETEYDSEEIPVPESGGEISYQRS